MNTTEISGSDYSTFSMYRSLQYITYFSCPYAMNLAAITEVIVNTSAVVAQTGGTTAIPLQQQVNVHNYTGSYWCKPFYLGKG